MRRAFTLFLALMIFSGCLSSSESDTKSETESLQTTLEVFPSFNLSDEQNRTHDYTLYEAIPYVAYFSASWCTHCKPTLDALDQTIPEGHLLVFNKDPREEYSNMTEWKEYMESELNRSLAHPFFHAPSLAQSLNVSVIPSMFFVNQDGFISHQQEGLKNRTIIQNQWDLIYSEYSNNSANTD